MIKWQKGSKGFTLIEILIVLAVLAVLAAVIIPSVTGYVARGKERAWGRDRDILQSAVDAWRTDIGQRGGDPWPKLSSPAVPVGQTWKGYIDIGALATDNYLKGADAVKSAHKTYNTTATQTVSGSYRWFIGADGVVNSWYDADAGSDVDAGETGFYPEVYP